MSDRPPEIDAREWEILGCSTCKELIEENRQLKQELNSVTKRMYQLLLLNGRTK
jgi:hypothetical protein